MSLSEEIRLVAQHEIKRNLRSLKGIVMFVLFFLLGTVPILLKILGDNMVKEAHLEKMTPEQKHQAFERGLLLTYRGDHAIASYLADCPAALYFLLVLTQFGLPLLSLVIGFDQIAGDVQHRSIRYLVGRAKRASLVVGKGLGIWAVVAIMTFVTHAVVWIMMLVQHEYSAGETLSWGLRFLAFCVASAGAQVGLASLVSSWFKVPILSLFIGLGVAFGLFVARAIVLAIGESAEFARWIFPATYETFMVKPEALTALGGCAASVAWGAIMVALATIIVQRKDV
jgi:ABC-type transport system involved in multi-copper enzyme maturation permease subunit